MLKHLLITTAVAVALGGAALAQEAQEPATTDPGLAAPTDPLAAEPAPAPLLPVDIADLTASGLIKASLQNAEGGTLGTVEDALLGEGGRIEGLVVSFGGFLGFGKKTVEIPIDEVELKQTEGGAIVAETAMTPESLEAMPEYQAMPES